MVRIEDGTGTGDSVGVEENRLKVESKSNKRIFFESRDSGRVFFLLLLSVSF